MPDNGGEATGSFREERLGSCRSVALVGACRQTLELAFWHTLPKRQGLSPIAEPARAVLRRMPAAADNHVFPVTLALVAMPR
jgi:hypothetical protein